MPITIAIIGQGISPDEFNSANMQHCANLLAIARVLIESGVVTSEQLETAHARALAEVDQRFAQLREERIREHVDA